MGLIFNRRPSGTDTEQILHLSGMERAAGRREIDRESEGKGEAGGGRGGFTGFCVTTPACEQDDGTVMCS